MAESVQTYFYEGTKSLILVKWKIRKGAQLAQSVLFHYKEDGSTLEGKEPLLKYKSSIGGTVSELVAAEGDTILPGAVLLKFRPCTHPVTMKDLCAECGMDLRDLDREKFAKLTAATTFSMVHIVPELKVSLEQAEKLSRDDEDRLLKNKKLVLLVDLDQTLIHTTNDDVPQDLPDVHHFQLYGSNSPWYHTKLRPGTQTFLENISKYYELHICTFGARLYAHKIAQILDKDGKYFSHRILSRDECFDATSKTGNLKALFPRGDDMVCIIDDREDVWNFAPNVIHVKPYTYFRNTGDINAPPNSLPNANESKLAENPSAQNDTAVSEVEKIPVSEKDNRVDETEKQNGTEHVNNSVIQDTYTNSNEKNTKDLLSAEDKLKEESTKDVLSAEDKLKTESNKDVLSAEDKLKTVSTKDLLSAEDKLKEESTNPGEKDDADTTSEPIDAYWDAHHADDYLLYLEEILMSVHKTYYDMLKKMKKDKQEGIPDLKKVVPYLRQKVLNKTNIVFSSIIPTNCMPESHYLWTLAESLGAQVSRELELEDSDLRTTHVVASKQGTVKVNAANRHKGIHIVSLDWLLCCAERWEHADERLFPVAKDIETGEIENSVHSFNNAITGKERVKKFNSMKRKHDKDKEQLKMEEDKFSERIFVEAGLSLSKEDIEDMDKEIDEACSDESASGESEESSSSSSSIESLSSGDYPKGWKKRRKVDVTVQEQENEGPETSDADTIGSVDEEMAEAVKQEFGNY